jgi:hypothetical protein
LFFFITCHVCFVGLTFSRQSKLSCHNTQTRSSFSAIFSLALYSARRIPSDFFFVGSIAQRHL